MKAFSVAAGAVALVCGCAPMMDDGMATGPGAQASTMGMPAAEAMGVPTRAPEYMAMASSGDMFEIESSRLALQRSRDPAIHSFAQMLINDHSRMSSEMMAMARDMRLPPPPMRMMPHHVQMMQRLASVPRHEFDSAFRREQIMAHEESAMLHRSFADRGEYPPLRALAARAAPIVEMHLAQVQGLPEMIMGAPQPGPGSYDGPPREPTRRRGERG